MHRNISIASPMSLYNLTGHCNKLKLVCMLDLNYHHVMFPALQSMQCNLEEVLGGCLAKLGV